MDPRRERTSAAIRQAFVSLLCERDYAGITVQDILERAQVGRGTFYAHFRNKEELLAAQVRLVCEHSLEGEGDADARDAGNPVGQVQHVLERLLEDRNGLRALVRGDSAERFADCLRHEIVRRARAAVPEHPGGAAGRMEREFLVHHIGASFVGMVRWWAWTGFATPADRLARNYLRTLLPLFGKDLPRG